MSRSQFPLSDSQMQALPVELRGVLKTVIDFYDAQLTQLREENKLLQTENKLLQTENKLLRKENAKLQKRVTQLETRLSKNSQNSSKPPSSDPAYDKKSDKKKPSGKKRGGQPGHKRHQRKLIPVEECNSVQDFVPEACQHCGEKLSGKDEQPIRHQVYELPKIVPIIDEYRLHQLTCPHCNKSTRAPIPLGVPIHHSGPRLVAFSTLMITKFNMSHRKVALFLKKYCGIPCSTGLPSKYQRLAACSLEVPYRQIETAIQNSEVVHLDETLYKLLKKVGYLWNAITRDYSLFRLTSSRKKVVAQEILGEDFSGIIITDRYVGYDWVPILRRQLCWAHLIRDFKSMAESKHEASRLVGESLLASSKVIFEDWNRFKEGKLNRSTLQRKSKNWEREVYAALEEGMKNGNQDVAGTCRHIWRRSEALWTFIKREAVEPTNNRAERALRPAIIKRNLSFGVDSESGRQFLERMLSIIATSEQQNIDTYHYLQSTLTAQLTGKPTPKLL